jgi:class 3 adenylate cyclase
MDKRFEDLLLEYVEASSDEQHKAIEDTLWREFGAVKAIFVMDMSGFSRLTQKYGIVHYLSMVKRMQITTQPIIEQYGGSVVKFEADNCFATFDTVLPAIQTAIALNQAFDQMNVYTDDPYDIRISIGIDYGDVLLIGGPDYFGNTVNRACKLGEDIAGPGEFYITQTAFDEIPAENDFTGEHLHLGISGIKLDAVKLHYSLH